MADDKKVDASAKTPSTSSGTGAAKKSASKAADKAPAEKKAASTSSATAKAPAEKKAASTSSATAAEKKAPAKKAATSKAAASDAAGDAKAAPKASAKKSEPETPREQVLKVHHLRPAAGAKKDRMRVGRGEGSKGKTAGRGTKGTKARYSVRPGFQGGQLPFHMRAPKLRGFKNPFRVEYQVVNLEKLAELYPSGGDVTVTDLVSKGAVRKNEKVKVLGSGDIAVKLNVAVDKVSGSAEQKILAAGGSVK
ncbi:MAG TPA: 50S ribosomal protein L15 [Microbacteriaceae bacterium]|nr:50S ribosomal protein L15 [Microbacteriaceae bacterium]